MPALCLGPEGIGVTGCIAHASMDDQGNTSTFNASGAAAVAFPTPSKPYFSAAYGTTGSATRNDLEFLKWAYGQGSDEAFNILGAANAQDYLRKDIITVLNNRDNALNALKSERDQIKNNHDIQQRIMRQREIERISEAMMDALGLNSEELSYLDYRLTEHVGAFGSGAVGGLESDIETFINWKETLTGLAHVPVLLASIETQNDVWYANSMGYFDDDPNKGEYLAELSAQNKAQLDAISYALQQEYSSCTSGGLSTDECVGLIAYIAKPL